MDEKVRIGFIGAGNIAAGHAMRLHESGLAEVVALADPSEASLSRIKSRRPELADVPTFADWREMLDQVPMDGVVIHSPHCFHPEQVIYSLDAGKHVLCEKPLASTVADAKKIIAKRDETGLAVMISYQRHFAPAYRYMREKVLDGTIGNVQTVVTVLTQDWLNNTRGTWRQDPKLSCGGQLNDSGSHLVDLILWTTDLRPQQVYAEINNLGIPVDVDSAITVRFRGGAIANVTIMGSAPSYWEMYGIWGSKGFVAYDPTKGLQQQLFGGALETPSLPEPDSNPDLNFVRAILGQEEVQTPPEWGLRTIELTEAAWRSAELGQPVTIE